MSILNQGNSITFPSMSSNLSALLAILTVFQLLHLSCDTLVCFFVMVEVVDCHCLGSLIATWQDPKSIIFSQFFFFFPFSCVYVCMYGGIHVWTACTHICIHVETWSWCWELSLIDLLPYPLRYGLSQTQSWHMWQSYYPAYSGNPISCFLKLELQACCHTYLTFTWVC